MTKADPSDTQVVGRLTKGLVAIDAFARQKNWRKHIVKSNVLAPCAHMQNSNGMTEAVTASIRSDGLNSNRTFSLPDGNTIFGCKVHTVTLMHVICLVELFELLSGAVDVKVCGRMTVTAQYALQLKLGRT